MTLALLLVIAWCSLGVVAALAFGGIARRPGPIAAQAPRTQRAMAPASLTTAGA